MLYTLRGTFFFHAFHTRVKWLGSQFLSTVEGLPDCKLGADGCNQIPDVVGALRCWWLDCQYETHNAELYYEHVTRHTSIYKGKGTCVCLWTGCQASFKTMSAVKEHLRSHTQEKRIACPTCGTLFISREKLKKHFERQEDISNCKFKCSYCGKAWPNERILKDHMRRHVNVYKCPHCDVKCAHLSDLNGHIRFRHSDERPYPCQLCDYRAKDEYTLGVHQARAHCERHLQCKAQHCNFSTAVYKVLVEHVKLKHLNEDLARPPNEDSQNVTGELDLARPPNEDSQNVTEELDLARPNEDSQNVTEEREAERESSAGEGKGMKPEEQNTSTDNESQKRRQYYRSRNYTGRYACHLCTKRFRAQRLLSTHLRSEHDIQYPAGHKRFRYKLTDEGLYQLQTIRYEASLTRESGLSLVARDFTLRQDICDTHTPEVSGIPLQGQEIFDIHNQDSISTNSESQNIGNQEMLGNQSLLSLSDSFTDDHSEMVNPPEHPVGSLPTTFISLSQSSFESNFEKLPTECVSVSNCGENHLEMFESGAICVPEENLLVSKLNEGNHEKLHPLSKQSGKLKHVQGAGYGSPTKRPLEFNNKSMTTSTAERVCSDSPCNRQLKVDSPRSLDANKDKNFSSKESPIKGGGRPIRRSLRSSMPPRWMVEDMRPDPPLKKKLAKLKHKCKAIDKEKSRPRIKQAKKMQMRLLLKNIPQQSEDMGNSDVKDVRNKVDVTGVVKMPKLAALLA